MLETVYVIRRTTTIEKSIPEHTVIAVYDNIDSAFDKRDELSKIDVEKGSVGVQYEIVNIPFGVVELSGWT